MFIYVFKCFVYVYMFVEYLWKTEMVNTAVQQALKFFVDRLGYESLKPKQETVVWEFLSGNIVFVALPQATANCCVTLVCCTLLTT